MPTNYAVPTWSTSDTVFATHGCWVIAPSSSAGVTVPFRLPASRVSKYRLSALLGAANGVTVGATESLFTWRVQSPDFLYRPQASAQFENPLVGTSQRVLATGPLTDLSLQAGLALLFLACENQSLVELYLISVELELYGN